MSDLPLALHAWERRKGSSVLNRRYTFESYRVTRDFLDRIAEYSKTSGQHPGTVNFGTTFVNITLEGEGEEPDSGCLHLADAIEVIYLGMGV
jgi:pterin-4a-carbinolamine dehydratase